MGGSTSDLELYQHARLVNPKLAYVHPDLRILLGRRDYERFPNIDRYGKFLLRALATPVVQLFHELDLQPKEKGLCEKEFHKTALFLLSLDRETDLPLTYAKYWTSVWFQEANGDLVGEISHPVPIKLPPELARKKLFGGILMKFVKRLIARAKDRRVSALAVISSFHLFKLGVDRLHPAHAIDTLLTHQASYSSHPLPLPEDSREVIAETSRTLIAPFMKDDMTKLWPTASASFDHGRSSGGNMRTFTDPIVRNPLMRVNELSNRVGLLPAFIEVEESFRSSVFHACHDEIPLSVYRSKYGDGHIPQRLQIIEEPSKERIVSVGPVSLTALQPLQGFLLNCWKKSPFSTMAPDWFESLKKDLADTRFPQDWVLHSGDYDAASDKLNINATVTSIESVLDLLGLDVDHGLSPGDTKLFYPKKSFLKDNQSAFKSSPLFRQRFEQLKEEVIQTNGQLMGHPLSFPLLCFINLSGVLLAIRRSPHLTPLERFLILKSLRINGDDIFFMSSVDFGRTWQQATKDVGFVLSIGKSYSSPSFGMINNVFFLRRKSGEVIRFGFLNQRLVFNHSLKKGDNEESPIWIGNAFSEMFSLAPSSHFFLSDAVRHRKDGFPIRGFTPNFFVPCRLGGLGVNPKFASSRKDGIPDGKFNFTRDQRSFAALCSERAELSVFFQSGSVPSNPLVMKFAKKLGTVNNFINSGSNGRLVMDELQSELPFLPPTSQSVNVLAFPDAERNFKIWLGKITKLDLTPEHEAKNLTGSPFSTRRGVEKRLDIKKLRGGVTPMSRRKLLEYCLDEEKVKNHLSLTYPNLPPPPPPSGFRYPSLRSRRKRRQLVEFPDPLGFDEAQSLFATGSAAWADLAEDETPFEDLARPTSFLVETLPSEHELYLSSLDGSRLPSSLKRSPFLRHFSTKRW